MCTYLHIVNATYYFRRRVPAKLQPIIGATEFFISLGTKDRDEAKRLIPHHTIVSERRLDEARAALAAANAPAKSNAELKREQAQRDYEQWQTDQRSEDMFIRDMEIEELQPVMDKLAKGEDPAASPADVARAAVLLNLHEREMAEIERPKAKPVALAQNRHASGNQIHAVERQGDAKPGKGVFLDTDIVEGWAKEKKPGAKGKAAYLSAAKLFDSLMGRKSVELITKADVMAYKRLLIADPKRSQINVRDKLAYLRTLLEWAAQEDIVPANAAKDVKMVVTERGEPREDFNIDDLNALFSSPVYSKGARPKGGFGEAAYWLPLIAIFMGARREEIGQLRVSDVRPVAYIDEAEERQEVWCIDITDTPDENEVLPNQIKNAGSRRLVPLHPKLIELGFVRYVQALPNQAGRVFPELKAVGIGKKLTDKWGQWFTTYKREQGIVSGTKVFHSLRHTWKTHAVDANIVERVAREFQGHEGKDSADKYGAAPSMRVLVAAIASYRVPGLTISKNGDTDTA